jgi:predicted oxidoreductase
MRQMAAGMPLQRAPSPVDSGGNPKMKNGYLSSAGLDSSALMLGLMRIGKMSDAEIQHLYGAARDSGINMIDHADVYGGSRHHCEARFGEAVRLSPAQREGLIIQTKAGIGEGYFDFSADHLMSSVDGSLKALQTDHIDVFLLHRPDTLVEPEEVAEAFDKLHAAGKVRHFGVSNHSPGQIELLKTAVKQPLISNQVQLSITHAPIIAQGLAINMAGLEQSVDRSLGLLDWSRKEGMTLQAWSPFQKGFFDGPFIGDRKNHAELNDALDDLARTHGVTPTGIAIAWILRHPARMQVVLGTTNPTRVREAAAGSDVMLSRPEWYRLLRGAGHILP